MTGIDQTQSKKQLFNDDQIHTGSAKLENHEKSAKPESALQFLQVFQVKTQTINIRNHSYEFNYYLEWQDFLFDTQTQLLKTEISSVLETQLWTECPDPYYQQIDLASVSFLMTIFPQKKKIILTHPFCSPELYLLEELEKRSDSQNVMDLNEKQILALKKLKESVEAVILVVRKTLPLSIEKITHLNGLADLLNYEKYKAINQQTNELSLRLQRIVNEYRPSFFEQISDFGLNLTASFAIFRIHILKFLAILPGLENDASGEQVKRMLIEAIRRLIEDTQKAKANNLKGDARALPASFVLVFQILIKIFHWIPPRPLANSVRHIVKLMAKRFIAGESISSSHKALNQLKNTKRDATLDQLGELVVSELEADQYLQKVLELIRGYSMHVPFGQKNRAGINSAHISIKVSALASRFNPLSPEETYQRVSPRLKMILMEAKQADVFINIDAEHYHYRDLVFDIYERVLLETAELKNYASTGIVVQAYLQDAFGHLKEVIELAKKRQITMPVRIVKGAYWDAETIEAEVHGHMSHQFLNKEETDIHFRQLIIEIFKHYPHVQLCVASHNFTDHCFAEVVRRVQFPATPVIEHQCLHMTYEALSLAMAKMEWVVRNYVPVGSLLVGMAYLVRRIMENSSQVGILSQMRTNRKIQKIPHLGSKIFEKKLKGQIFYDPMISAFSSNFRNVAPIQTYKRENRALCLKAIENAKKQFGQKYASRLPLSGQWQKVTASSYPEKVIGEIQWATVADAELAVDRLEQTCEKGLWAKCHYSHRSSVLLKVASLMIIQRLELAALIVFEAGKNITEALGDVDEAIDFLHFYAREERRIVERYPSLMARGICVAITPWNFPLAIPCGMIAAPLVAGNCVILKSAEQTPLIAHKLVELFYLSGLSDEVLIHLPGPGEEVGRALVKNPKVSGYVFTGSKTVGCWIYQEAGQRLTKNPINQMVCPTKVITEMGGKNAIIVTASAELDETISASLYSCFGHAGQKCSAASRILIDRSMLDAFVQRFKQAVIDLPVKASDDFDCSVNPVVDQHEKNRLLKMGEVIVEEVKQLGGQVIVNRQSEKLASNCVGPLVVMLPKNQALNHETQCYQELFGPIIYLIPFDQPAEAIEIFNATEYALTGGLFAQSQDDIDYFSKKMICGNIYVNRSITGARVGIEPFGGFKMSGTGPKAGGKNYLMAFHMEPINQKGIQYVLGQGLAYEQNTGLGGHHPQLARRSFLSAESRLVRFDRGIGKFIQNYEIIFQSLFAQDKEILRNFKTWMRHNFVGYVTESHFNLKIKGQLSYDDFSLIKERGILIATHNKPNIKIILHFLSALAVGSGLTILARNEKSFTSWTYVINLMHQSGFSTENLNIFYVSEKILLKFVQDDQIQFVIADGNLEYLADLMPYLFQNKGEHLTSLLTAYDAPHSWRFKRFLKQFILIRSFAVNTMRHGAPLEINS
jgi:RHH-type proline utilization regulon transcriptional repressor/proline dehydrogenase/delta 1-pyrroline-5-carboxylate dehydrogenase